MGIPPPTKDYYPPFWYQNSPFSKKKVDTFFDTEVCIVEAKSHWFMKSRYCRKKSKLQVQLQRVKYWMWTNDHLIFSELQIHILLILVTLNTTTAASCGDCFVGEFSTKGNSQYAIGNVSYQFIINVWSCKLCVKFVNFQQPLLLRTKIYQLLSNYVFKRKNS